jgi:hypothetical protein
MNIPRGEVGILTTTGEPTTTDDGGLQKVSGEVAESLLRGKTNCGREKPDAVIDARGK